MSLVEIFRRLGPEEKNVAFFWSKNEEGWKRKLAWNPVARFEGDSSGLNSFVQEHEGKLILGYLAYNYEEELGFPKLMFFAYEDWLEGDADIFQDREPCFSDLDLDFQAETSRKEYESAYKKVKDYIQAGDIYQMNLTVRFRSESKMCSKDLFCRLIEANPVNFMSYIDLGDNQILSASPERFIHTKGEMIHTYPIKGTRPRGATPEEDELERQALLDSEKEAAELNMITDLLRNDIGKVSESGSVVVREHRVARPYPSIWHTYSHVEGRLKVSPIEALLSMSPGGSITGCPKKRAMEIISELEPFKRGVYTGSIGMIEPNGDIDFNIAIRTILKTPTHAYLQVGGGIVYDSEQNLEWEEIFNKARPFLTLTQEQ